MRKLVDGNCSVGSLGNAIFCSCGAGLYGMIKGIGELRVIIGFYEKRIGEGMGKDSIGIGLLGRYQADD